LAEPLVVGPIDVVPEQVVVALVAAPPDPQRGLPEIGVVGDPEEDAHGVEVVVAVVVAVVDDPIDRAVGAPVGQVEVAVPVGAEVLVQVAVLVDRPNQDRRLGVTRGRIEEPGLVVAPVAVAIDQQAFAGRQGLDLLDGRRIEAGRFAEDPLEHRLGVVGRGRGGGQAKDGRCDDERREQTRKWPARRSTGLEASQTAHGSLSFSGWSDAARWVPAVQPATRSPFSWARIGQTSLGLRFCRPPRVLGKGERCSGPASVLARPLGDDYRVGQPA